jgi:hypothetical protein
MVLLCFSREIACIYKKTLQSKRYLDIQHAAAGTLVAASLTTLAVNWKTQSGAIVMIVEEFVVSVILILCFYILGFDFFGRHWQA